MSNSFLFVRDTTHFHGVCLFIYNFYKCASAKQMRKYHTTSKHVKLANTKTFKQNVNDRLSWIFKACVKFKAYMSSPWT